MSTNTTEVIEKPQAKAGRGGEPDQIQADAWTETATAEVTVRNILRDLTEGLVAIERARGSAASLASMLRHTRKAGVRARRLPAKRSAAANLWDKF